jgi:hypothetical protein
VKHIQHRNYTLAEIREIYGGDWGRGVLTKRPDRPVPKCWEDLDQANRHGALALATMLRAVFPGDVAIYLIGSRAAGYWLEESDWDVLLLTERNLDLAIEARVKAERMGYTLDLKFTRRPPARGFQIPDATPKSLWSKCVAMCSRLLGWRNH